MSTIAQAERVEWIYVVFDRDGGEIACSADNDETFTDAMEADEAARSWEDDPRYGSHDVEVV